MTPISEGMKKRITTGCDPISCSKGLVEIMEDANPSVAKQINKLGKDPSESHSSVAV